MASSGFYTYAGDVCLYFHRNTDAINQVCTRVVESRPDGAAYTELGKCNLATMMENPLFVRYLFFSDFITIRYGSSR